MPQTSFQQFHERFKLPVDDLSRLHLCRFSEEEEGWEWMEEEVTLQSYSLPREVNDVVCVARDEWVCVSGGGYGKS